MPTGKLFLIPSFLGEDNPAIIPDQVKECVQQLNEFIVEDARTARRYLRAIGFKKNFDSEVTIHELDKHAAQQNCALLLQNVLKGNNAGVLSEAGNPCIADPGNELVAFAHNNNIEVVPLVGPSSILLALIAGGFNGQQFAFTGYLPIKEPERSRAIKRMEAAANSGTTQLFMETPFRNQKFLDELLRTCSDTTRLCIACDLTLPTQYIRTRRIADWKKDKPDIHKRYCIFLMG
ncbi:MAG TPA: SAM-dependent methyltransferase [Chitinophagales bacterium]|nr:SAM-dependent methyltransferase [Chitinophagales bacterium]